MFSKEFPSVRQAIPKNIICCSGGNDSVALIQWAKNRHLDNVIVLYNKTGIEAPFWGCRIAEIMSICAKYKYTFMTTRPELDFFDLVRAKKGFPMAASNMSWCTKYLKTLPTQKLLMRIDPCFKATIYTGIRREESQNRRNRRYKNKKHQYGSRKAFNPIVGYSTSERNALIDVTDLAILHHGSMECFPCINSNRADLRLLSQYPEQIDKISKLESEMGYTSQGKPRVMFRPYRHMGATGIKEVIKWALCERGKYIRNNEKD